MKDKAKEIVKTEAKPRKKATAKINTDSKTKNKTTEKVKTSTKMGRKKTVTEERIYRALGCRFTAAEFKYVEKMIKEVLPIYKNKNKMLLALTREFVSSPLNDEILNKNKKIFLGRWATIFGSYDIRKVLIVYLQLTKRLFIAPTRRFNNYPFIDLEMLDTKEERVGISVKIDNDLVDLDLEAIDKMKKKIKIYLFTTDEEKQEFGDRDIECIFLKDVFEFMEKYQFLLPSSIVKKFKRLKELE
ncbi:hypothetical protein [Fusobacterium sp.]|uniref:hypothetical protein n=1 Tax=Fusobacterium sp. TaxID=68766 RepID=UPI0029008F04|nr:hypothetical protein [Fusobacterium sp.]MDU1909758.1 hypothetical protein [Fusobacterium sp.]